MPKRGQRLPYKLKTTWSGTGIRPFTQALPTESALRSELLARLMVDNSRGGAESSFEMWNVDDPAFVAPTYGRCPECLTLWGTEDVPGAEFLLCVPCCDTLQEDRH